jgi:hypothetical protein
MVYDDEYLYASGRFFDSEARHGAGCYAPPTSAATRTIASTLASTSASVVAQLDTLIRIAVRPCQTVPPHQQVPSAWSAAITR